MVLTRSSQMQTRNKKRSRRKELEHLSPMKKKSVREKKNQKKVSSYESLSESSRSKLTKLSNDRMAKATQLKKLKSSLRRRSTSSSIVIREPLKTEIKNEISSEDDGAEMTAQCAVQNSEDCSIKNEVIKEEPTPVAEEVESIVKNVSDAELEVMRDLLRNYIRMVAIGEDKFDISYNPLTAVLWELTPDQFYELVEILRDTDFMVKNADVARLLKDDKPTIAFKCKVVHKHNIFREQKEKRVVVKATFIKGNCGLRKMLMENPTLPEKLEKPSIEKPKKKPRRNRQPSEETPKRSAPYRPKRRVTEFDRPTILKRTQAASMEAAEERVPQSRPMFSLDNTGKLIVEKKLPAYSLTKEPTPATALSASERLKLRKEAAVQATEKKKKILKKLLFDVDLDARQEPVPVVARRIPRFVCLPLTTGVPTIIPAPKEQFR